MIIEKPQSFILDESEDVLFFDIFFKNNIIYLILPIYLKPYDDKNIKITYNDNILNINEKIIKFEYEPISIYKYDIITENNNIEITIEFNGLKKKFNLTSVDEKKKCLTLSTLFLNDYKLINIFYDYYIAQGVEHFYLYYNGKLNENIIKEFDKDNITLIEWPFKYWIYKNKSFIKYQNHTHHAQMGSLNHALYKYGKDFSEYMIFNDFDEYFYIPNITLYKSLKNNDYDIMQFCNRWSKTLDSKIPEKFPIKFETSAKLDYTNRSKNIYRCNLVEKIGIHFCKYFNKDNLKIKRNLDMFHFYNWTRPDRKEETNQIIDISEIESGSKE